MQKVYSREYIIVFSLVPQLNFLEATVTVPS